MPEDFSRLASFIYEMGMLQTMRRSGQDFLGTGNQTVGDHVFRTALIGLSLSYKTGADPMKVMAMALLHDIEEARTGDLNYFQQHYVDSDDARALADCLAGLPFEDDASRMIREYEACESIEAKTAKDADTLELLFFLQEQYDKGNVQAANWISHSTDRLITDEARALADAGKRMKYFDWWYGNNHEWKNGTKRW